MEYLQYSKHGVCIIHSYNCFKPCYKWNTFNTKKANERYLENNPEVLNLVINGIPSIQKLPKGDELFYVTF